MESKSQIQLCKLISESSFSHVALGYNIEKQKIENKYSLTQLNL